jgi:hypothetical protein
MTSFATPSKNVNHNADELSLNELISDIAAVEIELLPLLRKHPTATRVLVLGTTGSCKSTLVNALANKRLVATKDNYDQLIVNVTDGLKGSEIGHTLLSQTSMPSCWHDSTANVVYWDCPGFMDTRGPSQEVVNAFAMFCLLEKPCKVNILVAIQEGAFGIDRGIHVTRVLSAVADLFPDGAQLKECCSLVVTNKTSERDVYRLLEQLRDGIIEHRDMFDAYMVASVLPLLESMCADKESVFAFPAPTCEGVVVFQQKQKLAARLTMNPVADPTGGIAVCDEAKLHIYRMMEKFGNVRQYLAQLCTEYIPTQYRKCSDSRDSVLIWKGCVDSLLDKFAGISSVDPLAVLADAVTAVLPVEANGGTPALCEDLRTAVRYVEFVRPFGKQISAYDGKLMCQPLLESARCEIVNQLAHLDQLAANAMLAKDIQNEVERGELDRKEAAKRHADLASQIEKQEEEHLAQRRADVAKRESDLAALKEEISKEREQHKKDMERMERESRERQQSSPGIDLSSLAAMMGGMNMGGMGGMNMGGMGGMGGMDMGGGYGGGQQHSGHHRRHSSSRPSSNSAYRTQQVGGYTRKNGTVVAPYTRMVKK